MLSQSTHVFSEIFIHLNWHCKDDRPFLQRIEPFVWDNMKNYCNKTKGIHFLCIGGTTDHVHLAIQVEPSICLADWVGQIKGSSSHAANERFHSPVLQWQRGYGAVSFAKKDFPAVEKYILGQKTHHEQGKTNKTLEEFGAYTENEPE